MTTLQGIGASKGVVLGKVVTIKHDTVTLNQEMDGSVEEEIKRLQDANAEAVRQLKELEEYALNHVGKDESAIFEVHQMLIMDGELGERAEEIIKDELVSAQYAVQRTSDEFSSLFKSMDDAYMRERGIDIEDISKRIINILLGIKKQSLADLDQPVIIVTRDLLPSDTVQMDKRNVLGIITEVGSKMSHSSIIARTMQIPAVVGVTDVFEKINDGDEIIIDGEEGHIFINPDEDTREEWLEKQKKQTDRLDKLNELKGTKSITKDGVEIKINANIGSPLDVEAALENDAEGIGLFRSEFLYMHSDTMPSEESQFHAYRTVLEQMGDKLVTIRTLDVGGDKEIDYLEIPKEDNPFLGYRGVRICLDQVGIFKTQLKALLRASVYGSLGIMFPMICTLEELRQAKEILEEVKADLTQEGKLFSKNIPVGIMIETPAAVMVADRLAKECDFFSIGTNDLTQYTMAVDRMNPKVEYLYDTHNPSVLKLMEMTVQSGHKENIKVSICGEAAADPTLTQTFVDMGVDELSVSSGSVLEIREKIQSITTQIKKQLKK